MKKIATCISLIFLLTLAFTLGCQDFIEKDQTTDKENLLTRSSNYEHYYWYKGEKVKLSIVENKKFILFKHTNETSIMDYLSNLSTKPIFEKVVLSSKIVSHPKRITEDLMWTTISSQDRLSNEPDILYEAPYFLSEDGKELGLSHLFYVKLKSEEDLPLLEKTAESNVVEIIGNNEYMPLWYTLSCTKASKSNALDMANLFYETGLFDSSQPDLMSDDIPNCVNDPYFATYQWNLRNTGQSGGTPAIDVNFCNARAITQGSNNIIVAVLDQGIQMNHPDLNVHNVSYDCETGTRPSQLYGTHGTNCAGFISAKTNNNMGIAATAPNCSSMSISSTLAATPDNRQKRADGINFAWKNGASVISNSWGSAERYKLLDDAISSALTNGRSGKGCVVVFASGNEYGAVAYPANSNSDIIAVGSINRTGRRSSFSNYGVELDIVAPGEDVCSTTTNNGYDLSISGTSFSCPTVAGIAALILSVNPYLSQKEVKSILERTAKKIGNYSYTVTSGRPNGTWNNEMGYGLADASAAILDAQSTPVNFVNKNVVADETVVAYSIFVQNVNVNNNAKLSLNASESIKIEPPFRVYSGSRLELKLTR